MDQTSFTLLDELVRRDVFQKGVKPLSVGAILAIKVTQGESFTLLKNQDGMTALNASPEKPDMTFTFSEKGLRHLHTLESADVGDIGVELLKMATHDDPDLRLEMKVAIGPWEMLKKGYFSVLPLGGAKVTQHLASKGFSNLGKIRDVISRLRQK